MWTYHRKKNTKEENNKNETKKAVENLSDTEKEWTFYFLLLFVFYGIP